MPKTRFDFAERLAEAVRAALGGAVVLVGNDTDVVVQIKVDVDGRVSMLANFSLANPMRERINDEYVDYYPVNSIDTLCFIDGVYVKDASAFTNPLIKKVSGKMAVKELVEKASELGMEQFVRGHQSLAIPKSLRRSFASVECAVDFVRLRREEIGAAVFAVRSLQV